MLCSWTAPPTVGTFCLEHQQVFFRKEKSYYGDNLLAVALPGAWEELLPTVQPGPLTAIGWHSPKVPRFMSPMAMGIARQGLPPYMACLSGCSGHTVLMCCAFRSSAAKTP